MRYVTLLLSSFITTSTMFQAMDPTTPRSAHPELVEGRRDTNHAIAQEERQRMELVPTLRQKHHIPSLKSLCLHRIAGIISPCAPLRSAKDTLKLLTLQQSNAALLEEKMNQDLGIQLKELLEITYQQHLDGTPWKAIDPPLAPHKYSLAPELSCCCDYSPTQKLLATFTQCTKPLLLFYTLTHHKRKPPPLCVIDMSSYNHVHRVSFSPRGSFLLVAYNDPKKHIDHILIPVTQGDPLRMQKFQFLLPSKDTVHTYSVHFSPDDRYLLIRTLHNITICDLGTLDMSLQVVPVMHKIKRSYTKIVMNPTCYQFAARDYEGTIDIYSLNEDEFQHIAKFGPSFRSNACNWMACGTKLLIQELNANTYWNPITGEKQNIRRIPRIENELVAHSPCERYTAYKTLKGISILNAKTNKVWTLENIHPHCMFFDHDSSLTLLLANGTMKRYAPYEYTEMPLTHLLILCALSQNVLRPSGQTTALQMLTAANCIMATQGFRTLPTSLQTRYIEHMAQKLKTAFCKYAPSTEIEVSCIQGIVSFLYH